jgi:signal transduction histidine kinase
MSEIRSSPLWDTTEIATAMQLITQQLCIEYPPGHGSLTSRKLCERFAEFCLDTFDCIAASVWSLDPLNNHLVLMGSAGVTKDIEPPIISCAHSFSGRTVERKRITVVRDVDIPDHEGRKLVHSSIIGRLGLRAMISIPILDTSNLNQPLLVINLFPKTPDNLPIDEEGEMPLQGGLHHLADGLAKIYEMYLRDQGIRLARRLNLWLAKVPQDEPGQRFLRFTELVQEGVGCDSVMLYLEDPNRHELVLKATSGIGLSGKIEKILRKREAQTVCATNRERLIHGVLQHIGKVDRAVRRALNENEWFCAFIPLRGLDGKAQGTVLCLNRCPAKNATQWRPFTYEDVALIEFISEMFASHLAVILADAQRDEALSKVTHELRVPMVAFRAAVERIEAECRKNRWMFRYPYLDDVKNYTLLMSLLLKNLDTIRKGVHLIPLEPGLTNLLPAIIAPTKRFMAPLLRQRGFHEGQIEHFGFEELPPLYVDKLLMMQVVFNLLENAIKYYRGPNARFLIEIEAQSDARSIRILFRDWGIGVPDTTPDNIFQAGVRTENAIRSGEPGDGLGLWLAREVVCRHGGELILQNRRHPTEFRVNLPVRLQNAPPPKEYA